MRVLVTGYKGFIGSNLFNSLKRAQIEVEGYEWGEPFPRIEAFDWVMHIGAISSTTERDVEKVLLQNYDFSCMLYDECAEYNVNFQYSSSASVYGLNQEFREDSLVDPRTPYAWSKYLFERYVKSNPKNIVCQGFRYFNVYGSGEEHKGNQASPFHQFEVQAQNLKEIRVFKNSENYRRDFIDVSFVVNVHLKFLNSIESGVWNVGSGSTMSFLEVAQSVADKYDVPIVEIDMPEQLRSSYQIYTCADTEKLYNSLSIIPSA